MKQNLVRTTVERTRRLASSFRRHPSPGSTAKEPELPALIREKMLEVYKQHPELPLPPRLTS